MTAELQILANSVIEAFEAVKVRSNTASKQDVIVGIVYICVVSNFYIFNCMLLVFLRSQ